MFRYLAETKPMSDSDVYPCEVWFIFWPNIVCFVLFSSEVTIKRIIDIPSLSTVSIRYNIAFL